MADLGVLPGDFCESFLPYTPTLRQRQKAYAFSRNGYVHAVQIVRGTCENIDISARVYRSQRKSESPHKVNMTINNNTRTVTEGYCTCKAGISGECSHLLATIMTLQSWILEGYKEVPSEQTCTSLPQVWDRPRGAKIRPKPVSQMIISNPVNINRKRKPIIANFIDNRVKQERTSEDLQYLRNLGDCPISYLAQESPKTVNTTYGLQYIGSGLSHHASHHKYTCEIWYFLYKKQAKICHYLAIADKWQKNCIEKLYVDVQIVPHQAPLMEPVAINTNVDQSCGNVTFPCELNVDVPPTVHENTDLWKHLMISKENAVELEKMTRDQAKSEIWVKERKQRITASNFGRITLRKAVINDNFLKSLFESKVFTSKATSYGTANEKVAKQLYVKKTMHHTHDIGLIVNPALPFLGATPDGKVCHDGQTGIIEIKCPYSVRDLTLVEACNSEKYGDTFFLKQNGDVLELDVKHQYWYQVQGQLVITGAPFCDFITYTKKDLNIQRIFPDS